MPGLERELRELLLAWDPIGVFDIDEAWPRDEYDCLIPPLLARLTRGGSPDEIASFLESQLADHFGIAPVAEREAAFARALVSWYAESKNAA
jgi:hypothetical protein